MKKLLSLFFTLVLAFVFVGFNTVAVEAVESDCTTARTVFVHYHRYDGEYEGTTLWTWGTGTNGTDPNPAGVPLLGEDGFGGIYQICVDEDASDTLGLINRYGEGWDNGMNDRDGLDLDENNTKDDKSITIKADGEFVGFDDAGIKHVYIFEGQNEVMYDEVVPYTEDTATIAVIYFDPVAKFDGWNVWTWNNGENGSAGATDFVAALGVDGDIAETFRVVFIKLDVATMTDTEKEEGTGFIVRTDSWEKKWADDLFIANADLVAGDFVTHFYIAGEDKLYDNFEEFEGVVNAFEIDSAKPLDAYSLEYTFSKEVITADEEGNKIFTTEDIVLKDKDGNVVPIEEVNFNTSTESTNRFTILLSEENKLQGTKSPYSLHYEFKGKEKTRSIYIDVDAPEITFAGRTEITLEVGAAYSLPNYSATDYAKQYDVDGNVLLNEDGEIDYITEDLYNVYVKSGHGTVDTRSAGIYEVVVVAEDMFGNSVEETITVTITDPCATEDASALGLLIAIPVMLGLVVVNKNGTKKLLILVAAVALSFTLSGCGETCVNNAANGKLYEFDKNQVETIEIKFWHDDEDYALDVIKAFEKANPGIKVKWENVGMLDAAGKLETYSGSSYAADVFFLPHDHISSALEQNLLMPFPSDLRDDLITKMVGSAIGTATTCWNNDTQKPEACDGTLESELFGAPISGESVALFYNKTLLAEYGITEPATTMEEILSTGADYNRIDDNETKDVNESRLWMTLRPQDAYFMHGFATAFGFELFGANHNDPTTPNIDSAEMITALTWIEDNLASWIPYTSQYVNDNSEDFFKEGTAAYMINGPWALPAVKEAAENEGFEFGVTKLPTIEGNNMISFSGVILAGVFKQTSEPTAAFKFVEFLTSDEGLAIYYEHTTRLPALKDVSNIEGVNSDPYLPGIINQLAFSHPMPVISEMGFYWGNAAAMYTKVWDDELSPAEAAAEAETGYFSQSEITTE